MLLKGQIQGLSLTAVPVQGQRILQALNEVREVLLTDPQDLAEVIKIKGILLFE